MKKGGYLVVIGPVVAVSVLLVILLGMNLGNEPPRAEPPGIESLLVTADHCYLKEYSGGYKVGKGQKYSITCILSGMTTPVSYNWSCSSGDISGEGPTITWTAPSPPDSADIDTTVTVVVSDSDGNMMAKSVVLNVVKCSPCAFGC